MNARLGKEAMGRLVLEASTGMHGAVAKQIALELTAALEAQQAAERVPLTDEQLRAMHHEDEFGLFCDFDEFEQIARAVEQAHRITSTSGKEGGND